MTILGFIASVATLAFLYERSKRRDVEVENEKNKFQSNDEVLKYQQEQLSKSIKERDEAVKKLLEPKEATPLSDEEIEKHWNKK